MNYYPLETLDKLYDGYRRTFAINSVDLILLQHQGKRYLLENVCPHAGYLLSQAQLIGTSLRCPMHGYLFEISDGACVAAYEGPCRGLITYDIIYRDDKIGVMLPN